MIKTFLKQLFCRHEWHLLDKVRHLASGCLADGFLDEQRIEQCHKCYKLKDRITYNLKSNLK